MRVLSVAIFLFPLISVGKRQLLMPHAYPGDPWRWVYILLGIFVGVSLYRLTLSTTENPSEFNRS
jgi:hypothetical protein